MSQTQPVQSASPLSKVAVALAVTTAAFLLVQWVDGQLTALDPAWRQLAKSIALSALILPAIWLLRAKVDRSVPASIGIGNAGDGLRMFGFGVVLLVAPIGLSLAATSVAGWAQLSINAVSPLVLASAILSVLLFEALPEELIFRGYIYSHLATVLSRRKAVLTAVGLFVLFPVILVQLQRLLGMEVSIGGAPGIRPGYLFFLTLFGLLVQYLRVVTGTIWASVGLHLLFVFSNRLIGPTPNNLIQMSDVTNEAGMQLVLLVAALAVLVGLHMHFRRAGGEDR